MRLMIEHAYDTICLSPHLDDVVLSCGGMIHALAQRGARVLVATFFAGSPPDDAITPFALELKERWGNAEDPVAVRREEDQAAVRAIGAEALHLPYLDCVYRQDASGQVAYYPTVEHIFADVHPAEADLPQRLLADLEARLPHTAHATVYAPLTAGHHVDHILVLRMALAMLKRGHKVLFYEDYPYAGNAKVVEAALAPWPGHCWKRQTIFLGEADLRAKGRAVACYASQISTFWQNTQEMEEALRAQALAVGHGQYGENLWQLIPECVDNHAS
jgi:LmbE family N-acetylglucosaminyl deacetylase